MTITNGIFIKNTPYIRVKVVWLKKFRTSPVILDTGFSGDLQITPQMADKLTLKSSSFTNAKLANGYRARVPVAFAIASVGDDARPMKVLISEGIPMAGIDFFTKFGYTAVVDCKNRTVALTTEE